MKVHELKCWPEFFQAIVLGTKRCEIRLADRDYQVGDALLLREYDPEKPKRDPKYPDPYTGRDMYVIVTHITDGFKFPGVSPGYVVMSIAEPTPPSLAYPNRRNC